MNEDGTLSATSRRQHGGIDGGDRHRRTGLRALPGSTPGASTVVATSIAGRYIAGVQYPGGGLNNAVRWVNGRAQLLPGGAEASGVNSQGTVVGRRSDLAPD